MEVSKTEIMMLRELAKRVQEIANNPQQKVREELWRKVNRLERPERIPLKYAMEEFCWQEILPDDSLVCRDPMARNYEQYLRRTIWEWENLEDDSLTPDTIRYPVAFERINWPRPRQVKPKTARGAAEYEPVIHNIEDVETKIGHISFAYDEEATNQNRLFAEEIFGDILEVVPQMPRINYPLFDDYCTLRGMTTVFMDFYDEPEMLHRAMELFSDAHQRMLDFMSEHGLLSLNNGYNRRYNGGFGVTELLPSKEYVPGHVTPKDMWGIATSQCSVGISNDCFEEFIFPYEARYLSNFGLTTYGCCEPVDKKIEIVKKYPNLRCVSVSAWNDFAKVAEALGDQYIYCAKPTGVYVSSPVWDKEADRMYVSDILQKSRNCIVEVVNNNVSTCRGEPERVIEWVKMVHELCERFA